MDFIWTAIILVVLIGMFLYLRYSGLLNKILNLIPGIKREEPEETSEVPRSWLRGRKDIRPEKPEKEKEKKKGKQKKRKSSTVFIRDSAPTEKFRVPGLRTFKRIVWGFIFLVDLFFSQAALLGPADSRMMFWFFILHAWMALEVIWKTRQSAEET